jgi:hypothetical protein
MTILAVHQPAGSSSASDQARLRGDKVRVAALVELISREHGIRSLAAGGPIFAQLGLISPRVSPTAAVIVDPAHQLPLVLALEGAGWSRVALSHTGGLLPPVFTRVVHPRLVCPLDIYDIFPGFYAPPADAFERLWSRRATLSLGRTAVSSLDRVGTMLVAGHDQLGSLARNQRSVSNIDYFVSMFRTSLSPREQEGFVRLVSEVKGVEPMRPFLTAIGVPVGETTLPSAVYCQARLGLGQVSDSLIFAVSLFEAPPGRRFAGFRSVLRRHPTRVIRALLASPRSLAVLAGARARHRRMQQTRPA